MSHRGLAHPDKSTALLPPPVTMTCGTVAHQQLTYLTFISVREVDRCSGSYGSSLSCSLHGAHSAAVDVSFIRDIGVVGGGGSRPAQLWIYEELGGHGRTHPVLVVCRAGAIRQPGVRADRMTNQRLPMMLKILNVFPVRLQSSSSLNSRHVQKCQTYVLLNFFIKM